MNVIVLGKTYDECRWADAHLHQALPDARVETHLGERGTPFPSRDSWACDLLISILCPWIVPASVLDAAGDALNFHPGPPEYPGFGCYNFALYDGAAEYGVTCHRMDERIDHGQVVAVRRFPVPGDWTAEDLQRRSLVELKGLFVDVVASVAAGSTPTSEETWARTAFTRSDFESLRRIPLDADADEMERRIRAFSHSGHDGAYILFHGVEFHPRLSE